MKQIVMNCAHAVITFYLQVVCSEPGPFTSINYSKSDAWAAGTIAYELFGMENPFYCSGASTSPTLSSISYSEEDLPPLPEGVPVTVANLVHNLLVRNPSKVKDLTHVLSH
jgi:PTEN induced putative kinase 1